MAGNLDTAEVGDKVEFTAEGKYGPVSGDGEVLRVYAGGAIQVEMQGEKYKTTSFFVLSKAD